MAGVIVRGRDSELTRISDLVRDVRSGRGGALAIFGRPGSGRSTLLESGRALATELRVLWTAGTESERDIEGAGLHRLFDPLPDRAGELERILTEAGPLGVRTGVHRSLGEFAEDRPVLCVVDDAQRLDQLSLDVLAFAARRSTGRPVGFLVGAPLGCRERLDDIGHLTLPPLTPEVCERILADRYAETMPAAVRASLVELAGGNPAELVDLAGVLTEDHLAGRLPVPETLPAASRQRAALRAQFTRLTPAQRLLVLTVAAEDGLDLRTLDLAGHSRADLSPCVLAGLLCVEGDRVRSPSPTLRATLYDEAAEDERRQAHARLATVLDAPEHRIRWIWHRSVATADPDPTISDELAATAEDARRAGDHEAASLALSRAASLTTSRSAKARRLLDAAAASWAAGRVGQARALLAKAKAHGDTTRVAAEARLLCGEIELRTGEPALAAHELSFAADQLAGIDRERMALALMLSGEARRLTGDILGYPALARRAASLGRPGDGPVIQFMVAHFTGTAATFAGHHRTAREQLTRAIELGNESTQPRLAVWAGEAALLLGDPALAHECAAVAVSRARMDGEQALLPWALLLYTMSALILDKYHAAVAAATEGRMAAAAAGQRNTETELLTMLALAAASIGDQDTAHALLADAEPGIRERCLGRAGAWASWIRACLDLLDNRPADALGRLRTMATGAGLAHPAIRVLATPQFVEAAIRCDRPDLARPALALFDRWAATTRSTPWLAFSHRCHGLLADTAAEADEQFSTAITLHRASGATLDLARTELFYAQRLRRERKVVAAREHLRDALRLFEAHRAGYWEDRVRAELRAAGDAATGAHLPSPEGLTPQQEQIARLVADGETNREIARKLVISHRTVDHHLRNIFVRLGVRSRVELAARFARQAG
jgi:DNA-binding CsgD family transcriptional regulator